MHHLCQLPVNLARTNLGVRPCVAFLEADPTLMPPLSQIPKASSLSQDGGAGNGGRLTRAMAAASEGNLPSVEDVLIPRLDAKEVAAVFTAPFEAFLETTLESTSFGSSSSPTRVSNRSNPDLYNPDPNLDLDPDAWYSGQWLSWNDTTWRMHNFYVPANEQPVAWAEKPPTTMTMNRFRVFGMTARILVDAARVAFGREPKFEHNIHLGDEDMIAGLIRGGGFEPDEESTGGVTIANGEDVKPKKNSKRGRGRRSLM
jgi:hypothetical protein